ncbi:MAG: protein kinase [Candidatus Aminicenantes bacterium]|nr:MAG: protein kinase [Candidatus Aminicenantes bacterium]
MMECTICGAENVKDAKFCKACGASLEKPVKEIPGVTEQTTVDRYMIKERFKILKKLGKGGMGEVFLAEDVKLGRKVAIKSILRTSLEDTTAKIRFLREAQTASQLDHTNICTIYEIYEEDERDHIVMQYIDGVTLDQIIGVKKLSVDKITDISIQACEGMIEAHSKEIIHRDIKPGNIIIDNKGVVKILDFGLAKFTREAAVKTSGMADSDLTQKGFVMGTVAYISPEQAKGKPLDKRTDIFSFGVVLYEMIEGQNPFRVEEQIETLYNVLNKKIEFTREIPEELKEIVRKALEKDKEDRYQDFASLKEDLQAFQEFYARLKERRADSRVTEVIDLTEQAKILEEAQKTSDKENLGEMVDRIKKMKASTEPVEPTQKRKLKLLWGVPILVLLVIIIFMVNKKNPFFVPEGKKFYIYLQNFDNQTGEDPLSQMVDYLLTESLNQFQEFKIINQETALSIAGKIIGDTKETNKDTGEVNKKVDLELLKSKFSIKYELTGKISKKVSRKRKLYIIEAQLAPIDKTGESYDIISSGNSRDSLLRSQVDLLSRRIYLRFFPKKEKELEMKKVSKIFGTRWDDFSNFYAGLLYFKKLEYSKAASYFLKCHDLLVSKHYLSDAYYFTGKRKAALKLVKQVIPHIDKLTSFLYLKVRAIEARLNFKFTNEIKYLEQLKDEIPFSKEVFFELGEAYFHIANPEEAMNYYQQALELDKDYSKAINHLGYCHSYLGKHLKAIELFEKYYNLDRSPNSFDSFGDGYFYSGQLADAEEMKKSAVFPEKDKDEISYPYQTLADIYILKAQYENAHNALINYRLLEKTKSADAYELAKQAFIQFKEKKYERALELINQSLDTYDSDDINESSTEAHWLKGLILLALDDVEKSKEELAWIEKLKNKYSLSWSNFKADFKYFIHLGALILEKENQIQEAEQRFKELINMKTKLSYWITYYHYQFFHTEYAKFLSRNNRDEQALNELETCLDYSSNYIPALWVKAEILEKSNQVDEAKSVYEKIAELYGESDEQNYLRNRLKEKISMNRIEK